jgi:hypothetical protein
MVAGLQHDASVSKLKLLELQRAVSFRPIQSLNIKHLSVLISIFIFQNGDLQKVLGNALP